MARPKKKERKTVICGTPVVAIAPFLRSLLQADKYETFMNEVKL